MQAVQLTRHLALTPMQALTRSQAIERLRELLLRHASPKASLCKVMTETGLFCRGFAAWDDQELHERFHWFCRARPSIDRIELEALADRWQLADQTSRGRSVPCDIAAIAPPERCACLGWQRFSDEQLLGFVRQLEAADPDSGTGGRSQPRTA